MVKGAVIHRETAAHLFSAFLEPLSQLRQNKNEKKPQQFQFSADAAAAIVGRKAAGEQRQMAPDDIPMTFLPVIPIMLTLLR